MIFTLHRTSDWEEQKPLEDERVKKATFTYIDRRTIATLEAVKSHHIGDYWFKEGTNHREEQVDGCGVARDLGPRNCWIIEINTLEELIELQKQCKAELVISSVDNDGQDEIAEGSIEIYDDYRE